MHMFVLLFLQQEIALICCNMQIIQTRDLEEG